MNAFLDLFITFFKLGLVSFGGGYAMIPLIQTEVQNHHWLSMSIFTDMIAISAMAPGPIATNTATIVGDKCLGLPGAVVACLAVTLPSLLLILVIGKLFVKFQNHPLVKAAFYGLRPTIVGIIVFAAVKFALSDGIIGGGHLIDVKSALLLLAAMVILIKTRLHPAYLILAAGIVGMVMFG
ncbi:Chromate transporter [Acididesulfobacillus acetoxydans]|uniref:Chromate transporter n=1 Tax=Acididesulfobacillus acetoxydans TaxID=1561005 RepID=A0A8S0W1T0_9FIRM|nr:chromate transporter [Acididesulfobacillus acetoxydans]CAA7599838.1 Chromate transporter [Acididesulfobacillus acetoxydans]CEJ07404.1 Chromate transporter protein [Acididesulfobacillus acetoxydans]